MKTVHRDGEMWLCFQVHTSQPKVARHTKAARKYGPTKGTKYNKSPETDPKETEYELHGKKFKITVINMFNELRKTIMNKSENINRENILKSGNFEAERYNNYKMN